MSQTVYVDVKMSVVAEIELLVCSLSADKISDNKLTLCFLADSCVFLCACGGWISQQSKTWLLPNTRSSVYLQTVTSHHFFVPAGDMFLSAKNPSKTDGHEQDKRFSFFTMSEISHRIVLFHRFNSSRSSNMTNFLCSHSWSRTKALYAILFNCSSSIKPIF